MRTPLQKVLQPFNPEFCDYREICNPILEEIFKEWEVKADHSGCIYFACNFKNFAAMIVYAEGSIYIQGGEPGIHNAVYIELNNPDAFEMAREWVRNQAKT